MWKVLSELKHAVPLKFNEEPSTEYDESENSEMEPLKRHEVSILQDLVKSQALTML